MKTRRQIQRDAKRLYRACLVNGALDEGRVRGIVQRVAGGGGPAALAVLTRFQRLVRLDRAAHSAKVESATPLPDDVRASIEGSLTRIHGRGLTTSFSGNAALLGGVRVTVGSDVYDGSIQGRLAALEAKFQ
ncbi:MAG TPA: F0F1 ATP synthase subunit delta [Vicinamibacterales bacterium]|nr:F0F1 ATP synthase subunit delta [Vicinamibacterales bacterium]